MQPGTDRGGSGGFRLRVDRGVVTVPLLVPRGRRRRASLPCVGKAARNRRKRREECAAGLTAAADDDIRARLLETLDVDGFRSLLDAHPELPSEASAQKMEAYSARSIASSKLREAPSLSATSHLSAP